MEKLRQDIKEYTEAINRGDGEANIFHGRGISYALLGEYPKAITDLTKLKPRWDAHLWGDEDWLGCPRGVLLSALGGPSGIAV